MKLIIIQYFQDRCEPFTSGANVLLSTLYPKNPQSIFYTKSEASPLTHTRARARTKIRSRIII